MKNVLLISMFLCANLIFGQTATAPSLGDGSVGNPYQIATINNLYWITASNAVVPSPVQNYRFSYNYIQTADIDASATLTWFPNGSGGYYGWSPIGNNTLYFYSTYNGQGHTISGLCINRPADNYVGFFGHTYNAAIYNLGLINVNITGASQVGGLMGYIDQSTVSGCYTTGNVSGIQYCGDLVGNVYNNYTPVSNCYSTCNVSGGTTCGGLFGVLGNVTVSNCYSRGNVIRLSGWGPTDFGGFVEQSSAATIRYCYSTGNVIYTDATNPTA